MLSHEQCQALLREEDLNADVQAHLGGCEQCRGYSAKLAALDALLLLDVDVEPSADFDRRVRAATRPLSFWRRASWKRAFWKKPFVLAPAMAAALALLVVVALPRSPNEDELLAADDAEMLADMDMLRELDGVEDYAVIAALETLEK